MPGCSVASNSQPEADLIDLPPSTRTELSVNRKFEFSVVSTSNWQTPNSRGVLVEINSGKRKIIWQQNLPQQYGPRFILPSDSGQVLLLDDWLNIKSAQAIYIIHPFSGSKTAYSFDQIIKQSGFSASTLTAHARYGSWWIAGMPSLEKGGNIAVIPVAKRNIVVDLNTGKLLIR